MPLVKKVDYQVSDSVKNDELVERIVMAGDLSQLTSMEQLQYIRNLCHELKLNPLTRPFQYLILDGKQVLYATKDATDQLRRINNVSLEITRREKIEDVYIVTARATMGNRFDEATGAVPLVKEGGEWKKSQSGKRYLQKNGKFVPLAPAEFANAIMKAETKAKRRATLSVCGLGILDESELDTIADKISHPENPEHALAQEQKAAEIEAQHQEILSKLALAQTLDELKEAYKDAYHYATDTRDEKFLQEIIAVKDTRKSTLKAEQQEVKQEEQTEPKEEPEK